jgi:phage tail sheath protein FI
MALDPKTPGVYVQEVSIFPPSITSVATAIPAFIGYTTKAAGTVVRITSMNDYVTNFGGPHKYVVMNVTNPATPIVSYAAQNYYLYYAMQMYFANGGGPCYVISTGNYPGAPVVGDFATAWNTATFAKLVLEDEPTLIVMPELRKFGVSGYDIYKYALDQCNRLQDRFTIIDVLDNPASVALATCIANLRSGIGNQYLKYGAAYYPDLETSLTYPPEAVTFTGNADIGTLTMAEVIASTSSLVAAAWNTVEKGVRETLATLKITLPPSSSVAGIYAAVDRSRGVWKAPANVSLNGVVKPNVTVTNDEQDDMNKPTDGKAVNAIRAFTGKGILVWGARTLYLCAASLLWWRNRCARRRNGWSSSPMMPIPGSRSRQ